MMRILLSGVMVASSFVFVAPASAKEAIDFYLKQKPNTEKSVERAKPRKVAAKPTRKQVRVAKLSKKIASKPTLKKGRAAASGGARNSLDGLAVRYARENGVPYELAHGVLMVESRYNPKATGPGGYIGLMQLSYRTAQGMGYSGSRAGLYEPATNLRYGMQYLGEAYRKAGGNMCGAVSKYQGGHGVNGVTKAGSAYCGKVKKFIAQGVPSRGSQTAELAKARS